MQRIRGEITAPELLKLVLAVVCIIFLIYASVSMYSIFQKRTAINQAKELGDTFHNLESDLMKEEIKQYTIIGPRDWFIIGLPSQAKPSCITNGMCLCICEKQDCSGKYFSCLGSQFKGLVIVSKENSNYLQLEQVPIKLELKKLGSILQMEVK